MLKKIVLSLFALIATVAVSAYAAGIYQGYPIVGVLANTICQSFANPTMVPSCNQYALPGPSIVQGTEVFAADTSYTGATGAGGVSPTTIDIPLVAVGIGPYQYAAPLTGASVAVPYTTRHLMLDPAGTIATLTVTFPAASTLIDNQTLGLCTTQVVTALTLTAGSGTTVNGAPTALSVPPTTGGAACVEWVYRLANTTWYRVQ